jgi:hypothetical protein
VLSQDGIEVPPQCASYCQLRVAGSRRRVPAVKEARVRRGPDGVTQECSDRARPCALWLRAGSQSGSMGSRRASPRDLSTAAILSKGLGRPMHSPHGGWVRDRPNVSGNPPWRRDAEHVPLPYGRQGCRGGSGRSARRPWWSWHRTGGREGTPGCAQPRRCCRCWRAFQRIWLPGALSHRSRPGRQRLRPAATFWQRCSARSRPPLRAAC